MLVLFLIRLLPISKHVDLPVGVGFGIKDAASAAAVARVADAAVVGTVLVQLMSDHADDPAAMRAALGDLLGQMRAAMDETTETAGTTSN